MSFIGEVAAVGGTASVIAYMAFKYFGSKWLESKFAERLEAYKHKQNKELEEIRYRINAQFNRITKIHEKEIEVLPKAWELLQDALAKITYFTSPMRQYQDLDRLTDEQLEAFLERTTFADWEKNELRKKSNKLDYYQERIFYHEYGEARSASVIFHNYINHNSIFLSQDLKEKFVAIDDAMWSAVVDKEIGHHSKDHTMQRKSFSDIQDEIKPLKDDIEAIVQKRLHMDEAL